MAGERESLFFQRERAFKGEREHFQEREEFKKGIQEHGAFKSGEFLESRFKGSEEFKRAGRSVSWVFNLGFLGTSQWLS